MTKTDSCVRAIDALRRSLCWLSLAGVLACPRLLHAQAGPSHQALAESLFHDGRSLLDQGQIAEACAKFAESQRLVPKVGTLLNLATCHERQGLTATAWAEFRRAATEAERAGQAERRALAERHVADLDAQLAKLVVTCAEPAPEQAILLDGVTLGPAALGAPFPIDPGRHVVEASAAGKRSFRAELEIGPRGEQSLAIPKLEDEPLAEVKSEPAAEPVAPASPVVQPTQPRSKTKTAPVPVAERDSSSRTYALVSGGVAVVALAAGSYFGLRAFALESDAEEHCRGEACSPRGLELYEDVDRAALISTVAFAVGLTAAGVSVYFVASEPSSSASAVRGGLGARF